MKEIEGCKVGWEGEVLEYFGLLTTYIFSHSP